MKIVFSEKEVIVRRRKSAHPGMNQEWVINNPGEGKGERRLEGRYERIGSKILFLSDNGTVLDILASENLLVNRGMPYEVEFPEKKWKKGSDDLGAGGAVKTKMPGKILRILVKKGSEIEKGTPLLVMEAMKMENEIRSPHSGKVSNIMIEPGDAVEAGAELIVVDKIN